MTTIVANAKAQVGESIATRAARLIVRACLKPALRPAVPISLQRKWVGFATRTLLVPRGVRFEPALLQGVPAERIVRRLGQPAHGKAVLFLHGGAYIVGSPRTHRSITGRLAGLTGVATYVPDYRLAPEHPFPAALEDALACYRALLAVGYRAADLVVSGDSAGGGLALALLLALRERGIAQPAGLALISPWVDLTCTQLASIRDDALLSEPWLRQGAAAYLSARSPRHPFASPLNGDLAGLPPVVIQSAGEEILRTDSRRLADALRAAGGKVELDEHPRLWHDFQLYAGIVPEATEALRKMAAVVSQWLALDAHHAPPTHSRERN